MSLERGGEGGKACSEGRIPIEAKTGSMAAASIQGRSVHKECTKGAGIACHVCNI